ncbi:Cycloheximide resistance protein [Venturia nashicola]|uniref:Cycloheximide resistance protein n=1 Tax=Venturia nashicola TaxID=86259 RepID=A0A4Z1NYB3_9PEZI|nr:Cycloheximide resistance protein [Venturia nashicola]TLD23641.1 Cycloheximide resistance protein [Venturia nashicola]
MSSEPGLWAEFAGTIAFNFSKIQPYLWTELHVIVASLLPIITAAHASLSRPSSAAKPKPRDSKTLKEIGQEEDSDDDEEDDVQHLEGFSRSDALYMPLFAGITLTGLYFLIKWLKDLNLLNKVLNYYFSTVGFFSICKLFADFLGFGHSFFFPRCYVDSKGYWRVISAKRRMALVRQGVGETIIEERSSPLPGVLRMLPLPASVHNLLWTIREIPSHKITFKFYIHRVVAARTHLNTSNIVGIVLASIATGCYFFFDKPWFLTNLMGWAFSYTALQLISPTTFGIGNLILGGLFVYDIIMVFYTPMMVTVAKNLDVPIKLLFPRPAGKDGKAGFSMLGLGDIVVPGMMVTLALRFDLYLHYLRQQKMKEKDDGKQVWTANYIAPGKHFWTQFWTSSWFSDRRPRPDMLRTGAFSKTYFWASVIGYTVGMITTLWIMIIFNHAQPALLWLVPSVLGSLWGTALVRGEVKLMWNFTEALEEIPETDDEANKKDDKEDKTGKEPSKNSSIFNRDHEPELRKAMAGIVEEGDSASEGEGESERTKSKKKVEKLENKFRRDKANDLFFFSVGHYSPLAHAKAAKEQVPKYAADEADGERSGKRLRTG